MLPSDQLPRKQGRPRDSHTHQAILDATMALLLAEGFQKLSLEGVAARAGVSKTSIYRRWPSKGYLVLDVLAQLDAEVPIRDSGSLHDDMIQLLRDAIIASTTSVAGRLFPQLAGEIAAHAELLHIYREKIMRPRLQSLTQRIELAKERGEIRQTLERQIIIDLIAGPLFYHLFLCEEIPEDLPECLVDAILHGIAITAP